MKLFAPAFLPVIFLLVLSCSKGDNSDCPIACSEEYRIITVSIVDSNGNPVALDDFKITNEDNGNDLTISISETEFQMMRERGTYPLFSDLHRQEYSGRELEINFTGYINGGAVVSADYRVGADCCHVYYVSGDLSLEQE